MRSITLQAFGAFESDINWSSSNTRVASNGKNTDMYLFNNKIATKDLTTGIVQISDGDHDMSSTTKERLKPFASVYTKKGKVYCNDMQWDGNWITVSGRMALTSSNGNTRWSARVV